MIKKLIIKGFKSIEDVEIEPGRVNVLIGANGSGKSNILEAIGVLSTAAGGRVDNDWLSLRGVRTGMPALYKCAFSDIEPPPHIYFGAWSDTVSYEVSLLNPNKEASPWKYNTEIWKQGGKEILNRRRSKKAHEWNPTVGFAAFKPLQMDLNGSARQLLNELRDFVIYTPETSILRGIANEGLTTRTSVGLSGGDLPRAITGLFAMMEPDSFVNRVCDDALSLIDWAKSFKTQPTSKMPFLPSDGTTKRVISFRDKFMQPKEDRNLLSAYEVSEGALYVLFHAVMAAHPSSPSLYAVDNADHGLNPRMSRALLRMICDWHLTSPRPRQVFLTTHNPLSLDGLPLQNDDVRLFTVSRTDAGHTSVHRIVLDEKLKEMAEKGWALSRLWTMGHIGGIENVW